MKPHSQIQMTTIIEDKGQISVQDDMKVLVNKLLPQEFRSNSVITML